MKNKKTIGIVSMLALFSAVVIVGIAVPLALNNKNDFKNDKKIEIWTTNSEKDQFFNSFKSQFVDEYNKTSDYKVELVTVTPQESLSSDLAIKMDAKAKLPNIYIGKGSEAIFLAQHENDFIKLMNLEDYFPEDSLQTVSYYNDKYQGKEIKPYMPLMVKGESLFLNKNQMNEFISKLPEAGVNIGDDLIKATGFDKTIDYGDVYFNSTLELSSDFYKEINLETLSSYEGIIKLSNEIDNNFKDDEDTSEDYAFALDYDEQSAEYITYNYLNNNFDDWFFNSENPTNFLDNKNIQNAYGLYVDALQKYTDAGMMWLRTDSDTNPTVPYLQDDLTMFVGSNSNAKYIESDGDSSYVLKYDDSIILPPPTKVMADSEKEFVYSTPKTLNAFEFGSDEDEETGKFLNYVMTNINSDYSFYLNEGYLPQFNSIEDFNNFESYINDESNFEDYSAKQWKLLEALRSNSSVFKESLNNENFDQFSIPYLDTTELFEELIFEANRKDTGDEAVQHLITQLNVNV